mmetsp:Transcript_97114/g.231088  ORF Transcript_97114/g.231088 Transcript_97114/m.231088 type:complete len:273 (-) Transcript_97114:359-1177(-)
MAQPDGVAGSYVLLPRARALVLRSSVARDPGGTFRQIELADPVLIQLVQLDPHGAAVAEMNFEPSMLRETPVRADADGTGLHALDILVTQIIAGLVPEELAAHVLVWQSRDLPRSGAELPLGHAHLVLPAPGGGPSDHPEHEVAWGEASVRVSCQPNHRIQVLISKRSPDQLVVIHDPVAPVVFVASIKGHIRCDFVHGLVSPTVIHFNSTHSESHKSHELTDGVRILTGKSQAFADRPAVFRSRLLEANMTFVHVVHMNLPGVVFGKEIGA